MKNNRLQWNDKLTIKTGNISEYFFPNNVELSTLYGIRAQIFNSKDLQDLLDKVLKKLEARLEDYHEKHTDCLEKNQELLKDHIEITRAYNGLHQMGKFAEEQGIDIKKHNKKLPEYHQFEQEHTLLESGRVQHIYKMKKIKKDGEQK